MLSYAIPVTHTAERGVFSKAVHRCGFVGEASWVAVV